MSVHINYFGDIVLFTGLAIVTHSLSMLVIPLIMAVNFVFNIIPSLDRYLEKKYKGLDYVHLYKGYTEDRFDEVISKLDGSPTLWWLDAHFPGADYGDVGYGAEEDIDKRLPMEKELKIMVQNRDLSNDIIWWSSALEDGINIFFLFSSPSLSLSTYQAVNYFPMQRHYDI